jgi:hypothetical protein
VLFRSGLVSNLQLGEVSRCIKRDTGNIIPLGTLRRERDRIIKFIPQYLADDPHLHFFLDSKMKRSKHS